MTKVDLPDPDSLSMMIHSDRMADCVDSMLSEEDIRKEVEKVFMDRYVECLSEEAFIDVSDDVELFFISYINDIKLPLHNGHRGK